jgi:hypothetical protein
MAGEVKLTKAAEVAEAALRNNANRMLAELPLEQRAFFHRIHDGAPWKGWENCPVEHHGLKPLASAHDLLVRSLAKTAGRAALQQDQTDGR